ncbi:hypothetical protein P9112_005520 [Eukaryota sp. TZLM1-RC]
MSSAIATSNNVLQSTSSNASSLTQSDSRVRTADVTSRKGHSWEDYMLKYNLLKGIFEAGFEEPSPVQEQVIPMALMGKPLLGRSKNGTGKTASYLIPVLERISIEKVKPQAVVLVPTRELALQTSEVARKLATFMEGVQIMVCTGGTSVRDDVIRLRQGVHLLVGTPGRILDLTRRKIADLSECNMFIMDEADKLLAAEFQRTISQLLPSLPPKRQIMVFSATFPIDVKHFVDEYMSSNGPPHTVNLMTELTLKGLTQYYAYVEERQKVHCLHTLFKKLNINQSIIFCNSVNRTKLLAKKITELGYDCYYVHSAMEQSERSRVYADFKNGACRNLVSSDVFARGIDVPSVNVVVNFDMPRSSETFLHRVGRSGRFGTLGISVSFVTPADRMLLYTIEQELSTEIQPIPSHVPHNLYLDPHPSS